MRSMPQPQRAVPRAPRRPGSMALRALLLVFAGLLAGACKDDPVTPPPPDTVSLSGAVRTVEGEPIGSVPVRLTRPGGAVSETTTDASGRYAYTGLDPASYQLAVTVPLGFEPPEARTVALEADRVVDVAVTAVRRADETVEPGTADTLAVAAGTFVVVQAPAGSGTVSAQLQEAPDAGFGELDVVGTPVVLSTATEGSPLPALAPRFAVAGSGTAIPVTIVQTVPACSGGSVQVAFRVDPEAGGDPLFLYADSECTTWTDPRTGRSGSAVSASAEVPAGSRLPLSAFVRDTECTTGPARRLTLEPRSSEAGDRIPLVLIHGWQKDRLSCASFERFDPGEATFGAFLDELFDSPDIASKYSVYVLRYPTFQPVAVASEFLNREIESRGWESKGVVIVGHSMGGLVGRGYLAAYGGDAVRALVTLGTPHEGSPLADAVSMPSHCGSGLTRLGRIFTPTEGSADLSPGGPFISALRGRTEHGTRILTLAGDVSDSPMVPLTPLWFSRCTLEGFLEELGAADDRNDAVVPVTSALPDWTGVQHLMAGQDHEELTGGPAAQRTRFMLGELAACLPGGVPAPPAANAFPLSGTLARQADGRIDVVLNPIVVDGELASGLPKESFAIIENDCLKYFDPTTDEGNVGVDVVFVQDLSGSMSGAINGAAASSRSRRTCATAA